MGQSIRSGQFLVDSRIADASRGDIAACFELGIAYSTGTGEVGIDLVEAHKWFNLAALRGDREAQACRADIAEDMTAREIADAQRAARTVMQLGERRAA